MGVKHYAEVNAQGICFAQLETDADIDAPNMVPNPGGVPRTGQRWTGEAWEAVPPSEAEAAKAELQRIDADTGMSRTLRETLIKLADKVGADVAHLKAKEAAAVVARGRLK